MAEDEKPRIAARKPVILEVEPGTYWWCSCGRSEEQPFCDGSHSCTSFEPVKFEVTEKRRIAWCTCKHSKKGCICDGTHSRLP